MEEEREDKALLFQLRRQKGHGAKLYVPMTFSKSCLHFCVFVPTELKCVWVCLCAWVSHHPSLISAGSQRTVNPSSLSSFSFPSSELFRASSGIFRRLQMTRSRPKTQSRTLRDFLHTDSKKSSSLCLSLFFLSILYRPHLLTAFFSFHLNLNIYVSSFVTVPEVETNTFNMPPKEPSVA